MNNPPSNYILNPVLAVLVPMLSAVIVLSTLAQTPTPQPWPTISPYDDAICAFDKALTRAGYDKSFRERLTKSSDSAKGAVGEVGKISIPDDRVMIFFEPQPGPVERITEMRATFRQLVKPSNERIHIFVLPPLKETERTEYKYETFFLGDYDVWVRTRPCQ